MALSSIKIPEKVYVGFQGRRTVDEVPLGFMTPYTDDQAGIKRRQTVDDWANGYGRTKTFNSVTLENKPMVGFKIGRSIRRSGGWNGSGASYIRIEDPRGFELEITIENLVMCMANGTIENGEIMAECVWGRDGQRNLLLPTTSEPYRNSVQTKATLSQVISLRECKAGDEIELATGGTALYLGGLFEITRDGWYGSSARPIKGAKRYGYMLNVNGEQRLKLVNSLKVLAVTKAAAKKLTPAEIDEIIAQAMIKNTTAFDDSQIIAATASKNFMVDEIKEYEVTIDEAKEMAEQAKSIVWSSARPHFIVSNGSKEVKAESNQFETSHFNKNKTYYPGRTYSHNVTTYGVVGGAWKPSNFWGASAGIEDHIEVQDIKTIRAAKAHVKLDSGVTLIYQV